MRGSKCRIHRRRKRWRRGSPSLVVFGDSPQGPRSTVNTLIKFRFTVSRAFLTSRRNLSNWCHYGYEMGYEDAKAHGEKGGNGEGAGEARGRAWSVSPGVPAGREVVDPEADYTETAHGQRRGTLSLHEPGGGARSRVRALEGGQGGRLPPHGGGQAGLADLRGGGRGGHRPARADVEESEVRSAVAGQPPDLRPIR